MIDVLERAAVFVGQVVFLWTILACLLVAIWSGYVRNRDRERRREQEALSGAWARAHGGDPEYRGNLRGRAA